MDKQKQMISKSIGIFDVTLSLEQESLTLLSVSTVNGRINKGTFRFENLSENYKKFFENIQEVYLTFSENLQSNNNIEIHQDGSLECKMIIMVGKIMRENTFILKTEELIMEKAQLAIIITNNLKKQIQILQKHKQDLNNHINQIQITQKSIINQNNKNKQQMQLLKEENNQIKRIFQQINIERELFIKTIKQNNHQNSQQIKIIKNQNILLKKMINQINGRWEIDQNKYSFQFEQLHQKEEQIENKLQKISLKLSSKQPQFIQKQEIKKENTQIKYIPKVQNKGQTGKNYIEKISNNSQKEQKSYFGMGAKKLDIIWDIKNPFYKNFKVQKNQNIVQILSNDSWYQVVSAQPLPQEGKYFINVKINKHRHNNIMIGIITSDLRFDKSCYRDMQSIKYQGNGWIHYSNTKNNGQIFSVNDIVTVVVNMDDGQFKWYRNNTFLAKATVNQSWSNKRLYFSIQMCNKGDTIQLT